MYCLVGWWMIVNDFFATRILESFAQPLESVKVEFVTLWHVEFFTTQRIIMFMRCDVVNVN